MTGVAELREKRNQRKRHMEVQAEQRHTSDLRSGKSADLLELVTQQHADRKLHSDGGNAKVPHKRSRSKGPAAIADSVSTLGLRELFAAIRLPIKGKKRSAKSGIRAAAQKRFQHEWVQLFENLTPSELSALAAEPKQDRLHELARAIWQSRKLATYRELQTKTIEVLQRLLESHPDHTIRELVRQVLDDRRDGTNSHLINIELQERNVISNEHTPDATKPKQLTSRRIIYPKKVKQGKTSATVEGSRPWWNQLPTNWWSD